MLDVGEAQARLLALALPLPVEAASLMDAAWRRLGAPLVAHRGQPAVDLSAMDGYALRHADLPGPWTIVGESAAGHGLDHALGKGEAARIFTGAPLPAGADTILIQEDAARDGASLRLSGDAPDRGAFVRGAGSDFAEGALLAEAGALLTPARIALAAMAGLGALPVHRRPQVALLSTGDELVPPGAPVPGASIPASNGPMLAALLARVPATLLDHGIVPDRMDALGAAFAAAGQVADIIVTTGGVSVGDHDLVRPALERCGAALDFWRVAMRPGKPLMAGRLGKAIVLGLPGNPVSAFVTANLFLLPLIARLGGDPAPLPARRRMPLAAALPAVGARTDFLRARVAEEAVHPFPSRDSALLHELSQADALIVRPAGAAAARAGSSVDVISLA